MTHNPGRALRLQARIREYACEECGKEFKTRAENARFCGGTCRKRWHRRRDKLVAADNGGHGRDNLDSNTGAIK